VLVKYTKISEVGFFPLYILKALTAEVLIYYNLPLVTRRFEGNQINDITAVI
jgi:hypothetical protein